MAFETLSSGYAGALGAAEARTMRSGAVQLATTENKYGWKAAGLPWIKT